MVSGAAYSSRITAAELRDMGLPVPSNIPDCATSERHTLDMIPGGVATDANAVVLTDSVQFDFEKFKEHI